MSDTLRIATRMSPLAMWQAYAVEDALTQQFPDLTIKLLPMKTEGDKFLDNRLIEVGGKGLFVKELEQALLDDRADIAVHSMKDVPVEFPDGLQLAVICERDDPHDVLVSNKVQRLSDLASNAVIGTSSLRRQSQLLALRPDLRVENLRGNVNTRLAKLDDGKFDAIILAAAGLKRLGLAQRIAYTIPSTDMLPAAGQGAMGIECRETDEKTQSYLQVLTHPSTTICVKAERAVNERLQGGCQLPLACFATVEQQQLQLAAVVGSVDGSQLLRASASGDTSQWQHVSDQVTEQLLAQGAQSLLEQCKH